MFFHFFVSLFSSIVTTSSSFPSSSVFLFLFQTFLFSSYDYACCHFLLHHHSLYTSCKVCFYPFPCLFFCFDLKVEERKGKVRKRKRRRQNNKREGNGNLKKIKMKRKKIENKSCFCFLLAFLVFSTFKILKEVCFLFLLLFFLEDFFFLLLLIQEEEF